MKIFRKATLALLVSTFASLTFGQDDTRPSATWQVQKYDISATVPQTDADRNMIVKAKLDLKNVSLRPASTLTLRIGSGAEITAVNVSGTAIDFTKAEEKINAATSLQRIVLRLTTVPPNGTVSATVDYKFNVKDNNGLNALAPTGAQFLPTSFWYPTPNSWYFARGNDNAPFRIQVQAPGQTVVSSGSESGGAFDQKLGGQPFFAAGSWDMVNAGNVAVYLPKGSGAEEQKRAGELAAVAADARAFTATLLGNAPDVPLRIVTVKRGGGFAGGGTVLIEDSVLRRSKLDPLTVMNIADAVAKVWIGGSVSVSGDGFGFIREGLTRYIATLFVASKFGKEIADLERLRQRTAYSSVVRRDSPL
ncbi:MAG TPA: hypothetical protein VL572_08650, partial [Pyrinomonadaceae bacterium]|nr:hypothetical protein [Pyrinomonadaceae bacterium]